MKAITIYQPWASLIACGAKKYETRSWATNYRGKIAIHAGKTLWGSLENMPTMPDIIWTAMKSALFPIQYFEELPLGAIIATAELVGCHEIIISRHRIGHPFIPRRDFDGEPIREWIEDNEFLFGDWAAGRYAWEFANITPLDAPIPVKGKQRLWEWEAEI